LQEITEQSHLAYEAHGLKRSMEKHFRNTPTFTAWGTEVDCENGWIGTPLALGEA